MAMQDAYNNANDAEMTLEQIALDVAKQYKLSPDMTAFLISMADVEGRPKGMEFGVKKAKGMGIRKQAEWAAGSIRKNKERYHAYLSTLDLVKDQPIDFPEFFAYKGGPAGKGWAPIEGVPGKEKKLNLNWAPNMRKILPKWQKKLIQREQLPQ